jgi:carboxyl-terminal processing protease
MIARAKSALALLSGCAILGAALADENQAPTGAPPSLAEAAAADPREPIPVDDIRVFVEVFHKIKKDYVEPIDDQELLENAMRGMLSGLDPHSSYLDSEDYLDLQEGTSGEFGGLGIEVGMEDGFVKVIAPIDDTPAQRAGVQAGDVIIRLDETPVKGMTLNDAVKHMRGKPGSDLTLTVVRDGEEKPLVITLTRAVIKVKSVRSELLEEHYGYIRISQFQGPTGDELRDQLRELKADAGGQLFGVILDLRNNPGGVLGAAVSVSDAFLDSGRVVYTEGRIEDSQLEFSAAPPDLLQGAPLVVLVNEGSASASEIVAGALQDHHRALIMGRQTFGTGSVQTILPMNNETALKLTTARYFTPSGRSIQAEGITPDIIIEKFRLVQRKSSSSGAVKEADLARHLDNPSEEEAPQDTDAKKQETPGQALAEKDFELFEALSMLKGMHHLQTRAGGD